MAKRGESGLSLLLALDKPVGMTSHDVVNRVRRVYGERRVGHCGTLDPLASGVLLVAVGPAAKLDAYLTGHDKHYTMGVFFGASTETDDAEGAPTKVSAPASQLYERHFAEAYLHNLVGRHTQVPPVYSAVKVGGRKSYEAARTGSLIPLEPREIEIFDASLIDLRETEIEPDIPGVEWHVDMSVSKGTYLRAIARDMGRDLQTAAHVRSLRRTVAGPVTIGECARLDDFERDPQSAVLDPVRVLGLRFAFARESASAVNNGAALRESDLVLNEPISTEAFAPCSCTTTVIPSSEPPRDGEVVAVLVDNCLKALYEYDLTKRRYKTRCVFSVGVERGNSL